MEKEISSIIILSTFQKNSNFSLIPLIHPKEFSRTRESIYPFTWQLEKILKPIDSFFFSFKSLVSPQSIDYYYTTRLLPRSVSIRVYEMERLKRVVIKREFRRITVGMSCESTGGWGAAEARGRRDARYNIRSVRDATEDGHAGRLQGWPPPLPTRKLRVTMSADRTRHEPGNQYSANVRISDRGWIAIRIWTSLAVREQRWELYGCLPPTLQPYPSSA